jgi:hypothetical protein
LAGLTAAPDALERDISDVQWQFRQAAAVLSSFNPRTLPPFGSGDADGGAEKHLKNDVTVSDQGWILKSRVRRQALQRLGSRDAIGAALSIHAQRPRDPLQQALEEYILAKPRPLDALTLDELERVSDVTDWLRDIVEGLPPRAEIRHRVARARLLKPFRELAADGIFGRDVEVDKIAEYVHRASWSSWYDQAPLFVYGPGGVGKSTLLARMILKLADERRCEFVYVDLDQSDAVDEPVWLLTEAARQLALQDAANSSRWSELKRQWSDVIAGSVSGSSSLDSPRRAQKLSLFQRGRLLVQFKEILGAERRVFFALDSYGELRRGGDTFSDGLWRLLNELQALCPGLRVVMCGRGSPVGLPISEIKLAGIDGDAVEQYMQWLEVADLGEARDVADQVNGNPLSVRLAAELMKRGERVNIPRGVLAQGALYHRLLLRVDDPDIAQLARFSLIPRRLTEEILTGVLAEACGVRITSVEDGAELFRRVRRELILSREVNYGVLRHPPDVRRGVLELLRREDADRSARIHSLALEYYSRSADEASQIEQLYHRLALGQEPRIDEAPDHAVEALAPARPEFPPAAQRHFDRLRRGGQDASTAPGAVTSVSPVQIARPFSDADVKELQGALLAAFPKPDELRQMTLFVLNRSLDQITPEGNLANRVFALIQWARAQGRLNELVDGAHAMNSGNPLLAAFIEGRRG